MKRVRVLISGRVQGVSYRYYTTQQAKALGLSGWVKNLIDGRVEAVFEGEEGMVDEMIKWCREGSPSAEVKNLELKWEDPKGLEDFDVRY